MNMSVINRLTLLIATITAMSLNVLQAADKTLTLNSGSFGLTQKYETKSATIGSSKFSVNQGYKSTEGYIQMNKGKGTGTLYNTTPIKGLKSIRVNVGKGGKSYTVTTGTSQRPTANSQSSTSTKTFTAKDGDTYFQISVSGACYFSSIVITYDDSNTPDPDPDPETDTTPTVEVVKVTSDDKIIIEYDLGTNGQIIVSELQEGISGNIADDIFISKYYEAASNMKLFGIYNGTKKYIDLSLLRIRSNATKTEWAAKQGDLGYLEFKYLTKLKTDFKNYMLPPCTELIFWSNNYGTAGSSSATNNTTLRNNISMTIGGKTYKYADMEAGKVPQWYCLGDPKIYNTKVNDVNQFVFNGDDGLILERWDQQTGKWVAIDLLGAGTSAAPAYPEGNGNGQIQKDNTKYKINGSNVALNDDEGFWAMVSGINIPLSTNRYYLVRKKEVKSGANAVAQNKTKFATLATEWEGTPIGGDASAMAFSGKMFSEVGQYDFSSYYSVYEELTSVNNTTTNFVDLKDGTWSIKVDNLEQYACHVLRLDIRNKNNLSEVLARVEYQVPIVVKEVKEGEITTTDAIFMNHDAEECSTCDVVVLDNATLKTEIGGRDVINDIEIYPNGKLWLPSDGNLSVNRLIMRSFGDNMPRLSYFGSLNRTDKNIYFDKRIKEDRWYWFTLPFDCEVADISERGSKEPLKYGSDFAIMYYDGANRATGVQSGNWKLFTGNTLKAGVGYIVAVTTKKGHAYMELRFPMCNADLDDVSRNAIYVPVRAYGANTSARPNDKGWNLIGNPYLDNYKKGNLTEPLTVGTLEQVIVDGRTEWVLNTEVGKDLRYVVVPINGGLDGYKHIPVNSTEIDPFISYFVQVDGNSDGEELSVEFRETNLPLAAIRSNIIDNDIADEPVWVGLRIENAYGDADETTLLIADTFTDEYDMMDDLAKWRADDYQYLDMPVLATLSNDDELAFNALPQESAELGVPLSYFVAADGTYTFSLIEDYDNTDKLEIVELHDKLTGTVTDLLHAPYVFESDRIEDANRFTLSARIKKSPDILTNTFDYSISDVTATASQRQLLFSSLPLGAKVWVFTSDGRLVSFTPSTTDSTLHLVLPENGVYNIRIESNDGFATLKTIAM